MRLWPSRKREARASIENPAVSLSSAEAWQSLFQSWNSVAGVEVNVETALSVPAVWCAVNFIGGTIAALPLKLYKVNAEGDRERVKTGMLASILATTVNDDFLTSFKWRKGAISEVLLEGRSYTFVEKNKAGQVMNLWPLEVSKTTVVKRQGRTIYQYQDGARTVEYSASEIIDLPFLSRLSGVGHFNPVQVLKDTIGMAVAIRTYASKFFLNGGVPPLALHTPLGSPGANKRAAEDVTQAVRDANAERRNVVVMPMGTELKPVGFDPEKGQMTEAQRFIIEEIARIYDLPPVFLQDLTHGTFSNTEQQDLHFVKHTLTQWVELIEQELNAKLFGPRNTTQFVEFDLDGLLRGDFKTRMEGWAQAINTAQVMPNEVRRAENRPPVKGGDRLFIQGATVPLGDPDAPVPGKTDGTDNTDKTGKESTDVEA